MFLVSELDQLICIPYIDAVESYGLPSDTCPVPTSESGCAILDALPHCGLGFISTSTPCDGSDMATSYQDRRFKLPTYPAHAAGPLRRRGHRRVRRAGHVALHQVGRGDHR